MRKLWIALGVALAALLVWLLIGNVPKEAKRYELSFLDVFDTYSQVVVYARDEAQAKAMAQEAYNELLTCHRLFDIYHDYEGINNLKTVNDSAGIAPVRVDARLLELVEFAKDMAVRTNGRMNIAMGSVLKLWHDCRVSGLETPELARLPEESALRVAALHTDISQVIVDREASTLHLADPELRLDVGAVAKGYAVERAAQALIRAGVESALLNIGGNVRAIGRKGDGSPWRVGVQNPDLYAENQNLTVVELADLSLVSSGSYQRYYTVDGKAYHHIIDPDTLMPAAYAWGVSVVTEDSGLADALSTALFTLPVAEGQKLVAEWDGVEALWVEHVGTFLRCAGFSVLAGETAETTKKEAP